MAKYTKKPVEIEAVQFIAESEDKLFSEEPLWLLQAIKDDVIFVADNEVKVRTLEGIHNVSIGDYIIKGVQGELYPCKPDIFVKTYETV